MFVERPVFGLFFESFSASGLAFGAASEDVFVLSLSFLLSLRSAAFVRVSLDGLPEAPWKVLQIRLLITLFFRKLKHLQTRHGNVDEFLSVFELFLKKRKRL